MGEWKGGLNIVPPLPLEAADKVSTILKQFRTVLNIILTILQTAKTFLVDLGNPLKAILEGIVDFIISMLADLDQAMGIYFLPIGPLVQGQKISELRGGIENFNEKFVSSLYDTADSKRPQFSSITTAWIFAITLDSGNVSTLIEKFVRLIISIGESITQNLPAPENVRATPMDVDDNLLISNLLIMRSDATKVLLEWSLGAPNGSRIADAFVPPKWRIERSKTKMGEKLLFDGEVYNSAGEKVVVKQQAVDPFGRPVYVWEHVKDIDASDASFWVGGRLGVYKYKDLLVSPGETWFYRIRSILGDPPIIITEADVVDGVLRIDGILGTPCSPIEVFLTQKADGIGTGNPVAALNDTIYAALILGFHVPYFETTPAFIGHGSLYKIYPWLWDLLGYPVENQDFYLTRLVLVTKVAEAIAMNLVRSKTSFQKFWDAYKANKSDIDTVVSLANLPETYPYIDQDTIGIISIDPLRSSVLNVIQSMTGAMGTRGAPPNWTSFRTSNIIPAEVFGIIRKIESEIRGLLSAYDGIVTDIITFINLVEARINALSDLITFVESIIKILTDLSFPTAYTLLVSGDGVDGAVQEYLAATNGPEPNEDHYTVGVLMMWAVPGLSLFFELLQSFSGDE